MSAHAATRLVLLADDRIARRPATDPVRHYKLARGRVAKLRAPRPAFAHLARSHD